MSADAPRLFLATLRALEPELSIPVPERLKVLRELEFDLEQLHRDLVEQGLPPSEARRRAVEALAPEGSALAELRRLHASPYEQLEGRFGSHRLRLVERSALALATVIVLGSVVSILLQVDLLADPSPFLWLVLGLSGVLTATIVSVGISGWIKGDLFERHGRARWILSLSGATLAAGLGGALIDAYRLAATLEATPALAGRLATEWLVRGAELLSVSISVALAGGLVWFLLTQWLTAVSGARLDLLGLRPPMKSDSEEQT